MKTAQDLAIAAARRHVASLGASVVPSGLMLSRVTVYLRLKWQAYTYAEPPALKCATSNLARRACAEMGIVKQCRFSLRGTTLRRKSLFVPGTAFSIARACPTPAVDSAAPLRTNGEPNANPFRTGRQPTSSARELLRLVYSEIFLARYGCAECLHEGSSKMRTSLPEERPTANSSP